MPDTRAGYDATISIQPTQSPQMDPGRSPPRILEEASHTALPAPNIFEKNETAVVGPIPGIKHGNPIDKRSLDYVLRSGLAGGLAGCVVCQPSPGLVLLVY
jgi:hypothetical protein